MTGPDQTSSNKTPTQYNVKCNGSYHQQPLIINLTVSSFGLPHRTFPPDGTPPSEGLQPLLHVHQYQLPPPLSFSLSLSALRGMSNANISSPDRRLSLPSVEGRLWLPLGMESPKRKEVTSFAEAGECPK